MHEFTSDVDYAVWEPTNVVMSMKQRYAPWAYGLPKKITNYNAGGDIVQQTENIFDWTQAKRYLLVHVPPPSCKCLVKKSSSERNTDWEQSSYYNSLPYITQSNNDIKVEIYRHYTGRTEISDTYERIYKAGTTQFSEARTSYKYQAANYKISEENKYQSDGKVYFKMYKYSADYSGTPLYNNNILDELIETVTGFYPSSGNNSFNFFSHEVVDFATLSNGDIRPVKILRAYTNQPSSNWLGFYNGPGSYSSAFKEVQSFTYDNAGKLIGLKDEGYRTISKLYDYNDKYVTATVTNADVIVDKPSYSSFETTLFGGWQVSGSNSYVTTSSVTGSRALQLSSASLTANTNLAKPYILSFWSTVALNVNGGATLIKSAPVLNGFTYYEYNVPQGISSITVNGSGIVDELRLYPKTARMFTSTYDPYLGKTSECDENNRITYYEYDDFGRLRFIKDDKKDIVKMYEYNYSRKRGGCPEVYYNNEIREVFIKNNCPSGYAGSEVEYVIPANKYSSTISQWDADIQAQQELDLEGQDYANINGTCLLIYYNTALSATFTKEGCPDGTTGSTVTYTVPAGKYSSTVSQQDADDIAIEDMDANGQSYANANGTCVSTTTPQWEADDPAQTRCQKNGSNQNTGNLEVWMTDVNPNSATYGQSQWISIGASSSCPPPTSTCYEYKITVPNNIAYNLYVVYSSCISGTAVHNWNTQFLHYDNGDGSSYVILCLTGPPQFRYGASGNNQTIPEITVTQLNPCN